MGYTVRDIVMDADLFRQAYPNWPGPESERDQAAGAAAEAEAEAG